MDNLTHTLFAFTLARTSLGRAGRGTTTALVLASNAPDLDIVMTAGGALNYLRWHRGPTHGPFGVAGLGALTAVLVWFGRRFWDRRLAQTTGRVPPSGTDAPLSSLLVISMLGVLLHILMDLPTSYGTRVLSPFDWHWYSTDWMPIIDVYLWIALATGLAFGRGSESARRRNAAIAFVFMTANYGLRATAHYEALGQAPRLFGPLVPRPCEGVRNESPTLARWPRGEPAAGASAVQTLSGEAVQATDVPGRCLNEIAAMPSLVSPFRWRVVAHMSDAYELRDVNILDRPFTTPARSRDAFWRLSVRYPNRWTEPVFAASRTRAGQVFLGFARFPAARSSVDRTGTATVRWTDMRFVGGTFELDRPARQANLFTLTIDVSHDGAIRSETFGSR